MTASPVTFPVYHWDTPGLPPRTKAERCANHRGLCAYRDDDPAYCPRCHRSWAKIEQEATRGVTHGCAKPRETPNGTVWHSSTPAEEAS